MSSSFTLVRGNPSLLGLHSLSPCRSVTLGLSKVHASYLRSTGKHVLSSTRQGFACRAAGQNQGSNASDFNLSEYVEAKLHDLSVVQGKHLNIVYLKVGADKMLPVYIGDFESTALKRLHEQKEDHGRPLTYDLMKGTLILLGFRVSKVRIHALVDNTYHARVHFCKGQNSSSDFEEIDIDARPSDAINLAMRFEAPVYVNIKVVAQMAQPLKAKVAPAPAPVVVATNQKASVAARRESRSEILASCKQEIVSYQDPTVMHKLQLQLAINAENFSEAARLRNEIERVLATDRACSLIVAIETAIDDERIEEAARLRDELRAVKAKQHV